jgi:hypothetical protein
MSLHQQAPVLPRKVRAGTAVCAGVGVVAALSIWETFALWRHLGKAVDYAAGAPGVTSQDLAEGIKALTMFDVVTRVGLLASAILVIVWLWAARENAEVLCRARHRHTAGWVIGGWFCPVVSLWFPCQVVDDVWRTSHPDSPADTIDLSVLPHSALVRGWWLTWLGSNITGTIMMMMDYGSMSEVRAAATLFSVSALLQAAAAVQLVLVVRRISHWQRTRLPLVWPGPARWTPPPPGPGHPPTPVGP